MKKIKRFLIFIVTIALLFAVFSYTSDNLKDAMGIFAKTKGNTLLSLDLQNALYSHLNENASSYITISKDASERITAIQIHSLELSLLASELTVQLLDLLRDYQNAEFGIPIGNLTSSALLSGRGPSIPVKPVATGNIANEIQSTLQSAGINQTLHRVVLHFVATIRYISPIQEYTDTISFDIVIAETLVVGDVPIYRD